MQSDDSGRKVHIDRARGLFKVARSVFTEDAILRREQRAIFDKCWLYLGHASEIDKPGAFQVRTIGGREIIFNRDLRGAVHAFLNSCPHRGARLCGDRSGTAKSFFCHYHGWAFGSDGSLRVLPQKEDFPADFNSDGRANMVAVPRLDHYRDLYFICFDPDAEPLLDYLGQTVPYIDLVLDQGAQMEIVQGSQNYAIAANWKTLSENGIDGNHAESLHATYFEYARSITPGAANAPMLAPPGQFRDLGNGHAVVEYRAPWGRAAGRWSPAWSEDTKPSIEATYRALVERVGKDRAEEVVGLSRNLLIFPNLTLVDSTGVTLRFGEPLGPGRMNVSSFALAPRGEDPVVRKLRLFNFLEFLGPGGFATPDDIEALEQCQRSYEANGSLAAWNDMSKGNLDAREGPYLQEGQLRAFWREWGRRMGELDAQAV